MNTSNDKNKIKSTYKNKDKNVIIKIIELNLENVEHRIKQLKKNGFYRSFKLHFRQSCKKRGQFL